jgi:hypothetical protein
MHQSDESLDGPVRRADEPAHGSLLKPSADGRDCRCDLVSMLMRASFALLPGFACSQIPLELPYAGVFSDHVGERLLSNVPQRETSIAGDGAQIIEQTAVNPQIQSGTVLGSQLISVLSDAILSAHRPSVITPSFFGTRRPCRNVGSPARG